MGGDGGEEQDGGCAVKLHGPVSLPWCLVGPSCEPPTWDRLSENPYKCMRCVPPTYAAAMFRNHMTQRGAQIMPRYIGLDLHRRYVHGCEWVPETQQERHFQFPNTSDGWSQFVTMLDSDCWVAMEVTGNAFQVYDRLSSHAAKVLLANPVELKRLGSGRHTDRADAARLAKMLALGTLPAVWVPPRDIREVRILLRYRERLKSTRVRFLNQIRAALHRNGVDLPPRANPKLHLTLEQLRALPEAERILILSAWRQADALNDEIASIDAEIANRLQGVPEAQLLLTMTGLGPIAAAAVWAYIGDPRRFKSPKQVARYAGLDPSVHQSGESAYHGRISKNGNGLLRTYMIEAALTLARFDNGHLGAFWRRKSRQVGHNRAIVALARKMLIVAWKMMLTGAPYRAANAKTIRNKRWYLNRIARQTTNWNQIAAHVFGMGTQEITCSRLTPITSVNSVPAS